MTADEQTPQVGECLSFEDESRSPGLVDGGHPATQPSVAPPASQDELVAIENVAARLRAAYPLADSATVEATVRTAYGSFRQASVRAFVPILVERRARTVLDAAARAAVAEARTFQPPPAAGSGP
ncbi:three-helix bundle dimerization domain-containing protein [Streptomyces sp. NBC_00191]|uniref:three-helix bundle dimerization domain-containing protein n=1 Tax=Streptomyces sp. NBC_00191 TaxID=2975674 RepID=UPI00386B34A5